MLAILFCFFMLNTSKIQEFIYAVSRMCFSWSGECINALHTKVLRIENCLHPALTDDTYHCAPCTVTAEQSRHGWPDTCIKNSSPTDSIRCYCCLH